MSDCETSRIMSSENNIWLTTVKKINGYLVTQSDCRSNFCWQKSWQNHALLTIVIWHFPLIVVQHPVAKSDNKYGFTESISSEYGPNMHSVKYWFSRMGNNCALLTWCSRRAVGVQVEPEKTFSSSFTHWRIFRFCTINQEPSQLVNHTHHYK